MAQPHLQSVADSRFVGETDLPPSAPVGPPAGSPPPTGGGSAIGRGTTRPRAEKNLPTDRLGFEKQVDALRAIAQLSGPNKRPVTAEAISSAIGLKGNTGGLSNRFFVDMGWIEPAGRGAYVASDGLIGFARHLGMDAEDLAGARAYLTTTAQQAWHWQEIDDRVQAPGLRTSAVLQALAVAAGATANHRPQLELVIEWLAWLGLVRRDDDKVVAVSQRPADGGDVEHPSADTDVDTSVEESTDGVAADIDTNENVVDVPKPTVTAAAEPAVDNALVSMNFSVRITADDAVKLSDDQLKNLLEFAEKMRGK